MSAEEELSRVTAELRTYLRQLHEAGLEWYVDLPASADEPAPARAASAPDAGPAAANRAAPAPAAGGQAAPAPAPAARPAERDLVFAAARDAFVQETLARMATSAPAAVQGDIFTRPDAALVKRTPAEKRTALADLAAEVAPCVLCKLARARTQTVFGVGNPDADLVFIGEAPGRDEDLQGEPFVGRAGQLLNEILKAIDLRRDDVYICNILKCRPPDNRDPERDEVEACTPYLRRQLDIIEPRVICCLGRHAAQTLLNTSAALTSLRERAHFFGGIPVVVTFHPAALLRNPHWKRPTWDDVRKLRALYDTLRAQS
jgi:uracil-DNA glycosylase family 4